MIGKEKRSCAPDGSGNPGMGGFSIGSMQTEQPCSQLYGKDGAWGRSWNGQQEKAPK